MYHKPMLEAQHVIDLGLHWYAHFMHIANLPRPYSQKVVTDNVHQSRGLSNMFTFPYASLQILSHMGML